MINRIREQLFVISVYCSLDPFLEKHNRSQLRRRLLSCHDAVLDDLIISTGACWRAVICQPIGLLYPDP